MAYERLTRRFNGNDKLMNFGLTGVGEIFNREDTAYDVRSAVRSTDCALCPALEYCPDPQVDQNKDKRFGVVADLSRVNLSDSTCYQRSG